MKRIIVIGVAVVGHGAFAADSPPPAKSWLPPLNVWRDPTPVIQPAPVPGVPSPAAPPSLYQQYSTPQYQPTPQLVPQTVAPMPPTQYQAVPAPAAPQYRGMPQLVPQVAPQPAPQMGMANAPLPMLLNTPLPTTPSVAPMSFGPTGCVTASDGASGGCATGDCAPGAGRGSVLGRFRDWLCFQPGPPVIANCQPAPYQVPLRYYFPCVPGAGCGANGCGPTGCGAAQPGAGGGIGTNLGARFNNLGGLIRPAGHGGNPELGNSGGGVLGPIAGGCGTPGLIQGGPLAGLPHVDLGLGSDGCTHIKHKGLGACSEPSDSAPVTGPICITTQTVGVPLPASCIGSPTEYTGCYAGCDTVGSACRTGAGGRLLGLVFGTCHGGCSQVAQGGNGFAPTQIVPAITGYARPHAGNYRFADPYSNVNPGPTIPGLTNPQLGQPQIESVGQGVSQSGSSNPAKPFTRP